MIQRHALHKLKDWQQRSDRKPMLIRGARQVGKTTLVEDFSKSFDHYLYYNLEKPKDLEVFDNAQSIEDLINRLLIQHGLSQSQLSSTLLFIDEIQESKKTLNFLRFFYESYPELCVVATGSLLEHALDALINVPVGRVEYLVLNPLNFVEYVAVNNNRQVQNALNELPVPAYAHEVLLENFQKFMIIGGMPEVVSNYLNDKSDGLILERTFDSLIQGYLDDMEKYASNNSERYVLRHLFNHIPSHVQKRIVFQKFGSSDYKSREVGEAMRSLQMARLIELIYPINQTQIPITPNARRRPKLHFIDSGLLIHMLGLKPDFAEIEKLSPDFRGRFIEQVLFQEVKSMEYSPLFQSRFWVREKTDASAEVDMILQHGALIIPIEVKSGAVGKLRSLHAFMDRCDHHYAVRFYKGKFEIQEIKTVNGTRYYLMSLPYYLGTRLRNYIDWFMNNY